MCVGEGHDRCMKIDSAVSLIYCLRWDNVRG
jgi:hypothetical protein